MKSGFSLSIDTQATELAVIMVKYLEALSFEVTDRPRQRPRSGISQKCYCSSAQEFILGSSVGQDRLTLVPDPPLITARIRTESDQLWTCDGTSRSCHFTVHWHRGSFFLYPGVNLITILQAQNVPQKWAEISNALLTALEHNPLLRHNFSSQRCNHIVK